METWDVYNKNREKLNKTIIRNEKLDEGEYHISVHIWIVNDNNEFLIQKRSANKKRSPNMWAMTGGAVLTGEKGVEACVREIKEELDISVKTSDLIFIGTINRPKSFVDIYLLKDNTKIDNMNMQEDEVAEVKWVSISEIDNLIAEEKFASSILDGYKMCLEYISKNQEEF